MKTKYYIPALLAGMLSLVGCNDKEPDGGKKPADLNEGINFSIGQDAPSSRTHYATNDWLQIEWDLYDKITIFCDQTLDNNLRSKKSAEYKVTKVIQDTHDVYEGGTKIATITTDSKANIGISSGVVTDGLYWKGDDVKHTFYAGYGEGITIDPSTGVATCKYDTDQVLTLDTKTNTWINMKQAYMVACKEDVTPEAGSVELLFEPIMTTVELDVKGSDEGPVTIQALEVVIPESQDVIYGDGTNLYFKYDITKGEAEADKNSPTAEKIIFRLSEPQTVNTGEYIKITAILPPIEISTNNTATFSVFANLGSSTITYAPEKTINPSAKAVIKTTAWKPKALPQEEVDLGLSVKWATMNLGATQVFEYGDYYGWGCLIPYASSEYVNWTLYFHRLGGTDRNYQGGACGTEKDPLKDYVVNQKSIAGTEWDAATYRLGGKWRMPTKAEIYELYTKCTCVWTNNYTYTDKTTGKTIQTKVAGYEISRNGNSIFLPAAGNLQGGKNLPETNEKGYYWSSTPFNETDRQRAYNLDMWIDPSMPDPEVILYAQDYRYHGLTIRPVYDDRDNSTSTDINDHGSSGTDHPVDWDE